MRIACWMYLATLGYVAPGWGESGPELIEHDTKGAGPANLSQVVRVTENSASNAAAIKSIQADCPAGTSVIGGSAEVDSIDPVIDGLTLFASRPLDLPAQGWFAAAHASAAGSGDWSLQAVAICADIANVQRVDALTVDDSDNVKSIGATCPTGTQVLGGGARISGFALPSNLTLSGSYPITGGPAGGWAGRGHELNSTSETWSLEVNALCAEVANPMQLLSSSVQLLGSQVETQVFCPLGSAAIGGGATLDGNGPVLQRLSSTLSTTPQASSAIFRADFVGTWGVSAYAICVTLYIFSDGFES